MNQFGRLFRVEIYGESHGSEIGVIIDGVTPGLKINRDELEEFMQRRRPSMPGSTSRIEADIADFKSGIIDDVTSGAPILVSIANANVRSAHYKQFHDIPRPNHADFVASQKYHSYNDIRGGGHFSGRLTAGLLVAGYIAKKIIKDIKIEAEVYKVGGKRNYEKVLQEAILNKDSLGAEIHCSVANIPLGLGNPFFDSVESILAHAIFSIPGVKAIKFGLEKSPSTSLGSEYNDVIIDERGRTRTNNSGGILAGITNGNKLEFSVEIKPTASIAREQESYNFALKKMSKFSIQGRHDVCFALRVPVIIEALAAIALTDLYLQYLVEERAYELTRD